MQTPGSWGHSTAEKPDSQAQLYLPLLLPGLEDLFSPEQQLRKAKICPKQTHQVLLQTHLSLGWGSRDPGGEGGTWRKLLQSWLPKFVAEPKWRTLSV